MSDWDSILRQSHSGETLSMFSLGGKSLIRKNYATKDARVLQSIEKQRTFPRIQVDSVSVSAVGIYEQTTDGEGASILMPYIDGISGAEYAVFGDREISQVISTAMNQLVINGLLKAETKLISKSIFTNKLDEVDARINDPELLYFGAKIRADILILSNEILFPVGWCHGDLTLSNFICSRHQGVKLIDFLSIYLESPLQDVAKMIQEYQYGWSFRYLPPPLKVKGNLFLRSGIPDVINTVSKIYSLQLRLLTRISLYRIAPYVRDEQTRRWLLDSLGHYLDVSN